MEATKTAVVYTRELDSANAGCELARQIKAELPGAPPDAVILFASARYDHPVLLRALHEGCAPKLLVGSSSAGEFTSDQHGDGLTCALALRSQEIEFAAGLGRHITEDRAAAARSIVAGFGGLGSRDHVFRSALVMTDALAGHADDLVEQLTLVTAGRYQFFGGGAGDDGQFRRTRVFFGTEAYSDAAVALELLSKKPVGVGVGHGWEPAGPPLRVTQSEGMKLSSVNGLPAVEVFVEHAQRTEQPFDPAAPLPFFLHNILGIDTGSGFRLRVPLAVNKDGSVSCASEIPAGATVHIMRTTESSAVDAASRATKAALAALGGHEPQVAIFFDCVATRLRMGEKFGLELAGLARSLGEASYMGCNTHGQIARAPGQFGGFHNCTAVVFILPA